MDSVRETLAHTKSNIHPRHMLLLIDGTWVSANNKPPWEQQSNIYWLNLYILPENDCGEAQISFYIPGIGSASQGQKWLGGGFAHGLNRLVESAYMNIVSNFSAGDKLYIFGFSRGAVVACIVSYMISKFGVLDRGRVGVFPSMWDYVTGKCLSEDEQEGIMDSCPHSPDIDFLGLFDMVPGSLGVQARSLVKKCFEQRKLPIRVKSALHLLAMHESRIGFRPILFQDVEDPDHQHLEQVWMPGVHSDVGGGYTKELLGNIALLTMIDRLQTNARNQKERNEKESLLRLDEKRLENLRIIICQGLADTTQNLVINDEFGGWGWDRLIASIRGTQRRPCAVSKHQYLHPLCDFLRGKLIQMKSAPRHKSFDKREFEMKGGRSWSQFDPCPPVPFFDEITRRMSSTSNVPPACLF